MFAVRGLDLITIREVDHGELFLPMLCDRQEWLFCYVSCVIGPFRSKRELPSALLSPYRCHHTVIDIVIQLAAA